MAGSSSIRKTMNSGVVDGMADYWRQIFLAAQSSYA
jgi:hypothetical protein